MDDNVRRFNAEVAQYVQWDDHEVTNNWFHERVLEDDRYAVKSVALLAARAKRAMFEFTTLAGAPLTRASASTGGSGEGRRSTSSCSTCGATAGRTARTARPR